MSVLDEATAIDDYVVLRGRLGLHLQGADPAEVEVALLDAIVEAVEDLGVAVDLLQLSPGIDPSWGLAGPVNHVIVHPIDGARA